MNTKMLSKTSNEGQEDQGADSVFDFLYHDGRRVASLLAQFDPSGHLHSISKGHSANEGRDSISTLSTSGSVPAIASIKSDNEEVINRSHSESIERVYDPTWANARELLDLLEGRGLLQRGLDGARLGQLVLVQGKLSIFDLQMLSGLWSLEPIQEKIKEGLPTVPKLPKKATETPQMRERIRKAKAEREQAEFGYRLFKDMAPILPHTAQAEITDEYGNRVWCTMSPSGLTTSPPEIALKHGFDVPGDWVALGILDADPDYGSTQPREITPDGEEMAMKVFEGFAPAIRTILGRPAAAYGVTPLMVFREVLAT